MIKFSTSILVSIVLAFLFFVPPAPASDQSAARSPEFELALERWKNRQRNPYKIIGGHDANYASYQWELALVNATIPDNYYAQFCGASYIARFWAITASHCVAGLDPGDIQVMYGSSKLDTSGNRDSIDLIVRCDHCADGRASDLALLKLHDAPPIPTVSMMPQETAATVLKSGAIVIISGWGLLDPVTNNFRSPTLREATVDFQTLDDCNGPESYDGAVSQRWSFCAGFTDGAIDSCAGDSGGPALIEVNGARLLAGVVSRGDSCGKPKKYGVYTSVSEFGKWIETHAK
jgi:secreted trypsin-like serine protease